MCIELKLEIEPTICRVCKNISDNGLDLCSNCDKQIQDNTAQELAHQLEQLGVKIEDILLTPVEE